MEASTFHMELFLRPMLSAPTVNGATRFFLFFFFNFLWKKGNIQLLVYSGNKATLINFLRENGNGQGTEYGNIEHKTCATSSDSDQPVHPHERGRYNLHADFK